MEGIPTFSMCASSMAWPVSNKTLKLIEQPMTFERQQWLNNLAYCQWREDECIAGMPEHLRKKICQNKFADLTIHPNSAKLSAGNFKIEKSVGTKET